MKKTQGQKETNDWPKAWFNANDLWMKDQMKIPWLMKYMTKWNGYADTGET